MKDFKTLVPLKTAAEQLVSLHRAWNEESKAKDERAKVIEINDYEDDFWKTIEKPVGKTDPPHVWDRAKKQFENPVMDADWYEPQIDNRISIKGRNNGGKKNPATQPCDPKRIRINITLEINDENIDSDDDLN